MCRSRRELSKEYLLANVGFDTAENEPSKLPHSPRTDPCPDHYYYRSPRLDARQMAIDDLQKIACGLATKVDEMLSAFKVDTD